MFGWTGGSSCHTPKVDYVEEEVNNEEDANVVEEANIEEETKSRRMQYGA